MKYDFAHPKFKNGMVTFAEKKPDLVYEFRMAAARHKYNLRQDMYLYDRNGEKMAKGRKLWSHAPGYYARRFRYGFSPHQHQGRY